MLRAHQAEQWEYAMKTLRVELPDDLVAHLEYVVEQGWFTGESEVIRLAVAEFLKSHRYALLEQHQREDIAWALQQKA